MHRNWLKDQLIQYRERWGDQERVAQFLDFVDAEETCFERSCRPGHITGSALLISPDGGSTLLTHHKKLNMWLQLGGHSDGDSNTLDVAIKEAREESGIDNVEPVNEEIFHIDRHWIPDSKKEPGHYHYDVRFLLRAGHDNFVVSEESHELKWFSKEDIQKTELEESLQALTRRWIEL